MKRKNKWLLSCIAIASLGISSVEARVPYVVAKYYLPYLLKVFGIEDKQRDDESLQEREKIDHSNIETSGNGENGNEIIIDKKNINGIEKWCKEKPTKKEQAILDLIYTDEGQEEMYKWAKEDKTPEKLKVFLEENNYENNTDEIPLEGGLSFCPGRFFNISVANSHTLGGKILKSTTYAKELFEKLKIINDSQNYLLKRLNAKDNGKTADKSIATKIIKVNNKTIEVADGKKVGPRKSKKINKILDGKELELSDKTEIEILQRKLIENLREESVDLRGFKLIKKLEDLCTINEKTVIAEMKEYLEQKLKENKISEFNVIEANKVARIVYLLCYIDVEEDLYYIINSILFTNENKKNECEEIVNLKNIKDDLLFEKEYDCRPMPNSVVEKEKVTNDGKIEGEITTLNMVGDCNEVLIRHLVTISLRHKNMANVGGMKSISDFGKNLISELSAPQSGIMRINDHHCWRDLFLRKVIRAHYKEYFNEHFDEYFDDVNKRYRELDENTGYPYEIGSSIENVSELLELFRISFPNDENEKNNKKEKKMVGYVEARYSRTLKDTVGSIRISKFVNKDKSIEENYENQIEKAMNGIYELSGKKEIEGQRFKVKVLDHKNGTSEKCLPLEKELKERYNGDTWYEKYDCDYLIVVSDKLFNRTYICIIDTDAHSEMVEVINEILVK